MPRKILITGGIFSFLVVAIGAFGAHALKPMLIENGRLATFETGVQYQMMHGIALLILGLVYEKKPSKFITYSVWLFSIGIVIFSGSLYLLSTLNLPALGMITPFGGLAFLGGWITFILGLFKD